MRAVTSRAITVRWTCTTEDGVASDADTPPTVVANDGAGTQLATGSASHAGTGKYTFTLTTPPANLDVLSVVFTAALAGAPIVETVEVKMQDRRIVPLNLLRADDTLSGLDAEDFLLLVDSAEDMFEHALRYSPVVRGVRARVEAADTDRLRFPGYINPQTVYSLNYTLGGYSHDFTTDELSRLHVQDGAIEYFYGTFAFPDILFGYPRTIGAFRAGIYTVSMAEGETSTPRDLARAFLTYCHYLAQTSDWPMRAKRVMSEQSDIWLQMADAGNSPTGIPEVDAVLMAYRAEMPVAGRLI